MKSSIIFSIGLIDPYTLTIPDNIMKVFENDIPERFRISATFNDKTINFHAAIKYYKTSESFKMMFGKRLQKELGVYQNDYFEMQLFEDTSKYGVEMPSELDEVFKTDFEAYQIFENLTRGKQRSIIYAIIRYKISQTKIDKALILCENLKRGERNPMKLFKSNYL